jgi:hypothetical protein
MIRTDRRAVLVAAGLVALFAGLVVNFPARLALDWFAPSGLRAWGVEGTLWRGRAAELALDDRSLGALSWRARSAAMLVLRPTWDLDLRRPDGYARGRVGFSIFADRQRITDLEATLALGTLPPAIVPLGVGGQLQASLQRLDLERGWPTAIVGRAMVRDLSLPGVIITFGPLSFQFPEQGGAPAGEIVATEGPLLLDGRLELPARDQWRFRAEVAPGQDPPRELIEGLAFIGEDLGGGRRLLTFSSEP